MSLRSIFSAFGKKPPAEQPATWAVHATSHCKLHHHPEFRIRVSNGAVPAADISWLLQHFEKRVAQGEKFRSGESLQLGWMFPMLAEGPENSLVVLEPDMVAIPVAFIDSVDATLMHLRTQQDVVRSLLPSVEPEFPSLRQSVVVHVNYKQARRILLTRSSPVDGTDSGWWFTDLDDKDGSQDPTHFFKTSLYQLGIDRPDLIQFLAVPVGLQVVVDGVRIGVLGEAGEVEQMPGSYLSELNKRRQQYAS